MRIPCDANPLFSHKLKIKGENKMIGIYLITNNVNQKKYVGQSNNIERRTKEHLRSAQPDKYSKKNERDSKTPIHLAMQKYGIQNFSFSILEECSVEQLNEREKYWIKYFQSNNKEKGYNLTSGGQETIGVSGENHSQAKLTQKEVDQIKILLQENQMSLTEINNLFPCVSKSTISMINNGKIWKQENEIYPLRPVNYGNAGSTNGRAKFNESQVKEMRELYSNGVKPSEICKKFNHIASDNTIKAILYGKTFKHLPIWNNKLKQWI